MTTLTRLSLAVARLGVPEFLPLSYLLEQLTIEAESSASQCESNRRLSASLYDLLEGENRVPEALTVRDVLDYYRALEFQRA